MNECRHQVNEWYWTPCSFRYHITTLNIATLSQRGFLSVILDQQSSIVELFLQNGVRAYNMILKLYL